MVEIDRAGGAAGAVAGYEFQFTWTARRCISMLRHDSPITQICVEGLDYEDEIDFGQGPETFLGVDTSEYHGGSNFSKADKLVISQLKCGISHPNKKWTIARLCKRKRTRLSSVVGRLASTFDGLYKKKQAKVLIDKLRLQVVSNCPLDTSVCKVISQSQDILEEFELAPEKWQFGKLKKSGFTNKQVSELETLYSASGLSSNAFCVFLSCLDMTVFSVESPILQRTVLEEEVKAFDRSHHENALLKLCHLIREMAQRGGGTITADHVLSCFGTNKDGFLPAPCLIKTPSFVVETDDICNLADLLTKPKTRRVLAHGEAGIGKSLTVKTVGKYLPPGSTTVVYDCYAGGETETPDKFRFPEIVFCSQITNELSIAVGQDIHLIRSRTDQRDAWNTLQVAINKASQKLQKRDALLVLIIDAADNAAGSYEKHKSQTNDNAFISYLWNISIPNNVRLVFTCRTFRRELLRAPSDIIQFKLDGFSKQNSLQYLRRSFPRANKKIGDAFHDKTIGVPRHQNYWLAELKGTKDKDVFDEIQQRDSFGLVNLYNDWLTSAQAILPPKVPCKKIVGLLRVAASPVPLSVISSCLGIDESKTIQFCQGLGPGILLGTSQEDLRFRDEDYETFLDGMLNDIDVQSAHAILAHHCLRTIEGGGYSAKYACMHLFKSDRHKELLGIVLERCGIDTFSDPIEVNQHEKNRINLAFKSTAFIQDPVSALRLLFEVGRINRTDQLLSSTIAEHPELVIRHNSYQALEDSLLDNVDGDVNGKVFFRIASILSEDSRHEELAKQNLRKGQAWLRVLIAEAKENDWHRFNYDRNDSAFEAIAALNLYGPYAAGQVLRCWVNPSIKLESLFYFFRQLSRKNDRKKVLKVFDKCPALALARAAAIAGMYEIGIKPKKAEVIYIAERLRKWIIKYGHKYNVIGIWIVSFLELAAKCGVSKDVLIEINSQLHFSHNERMHYRLSADRWKESLGRYTQFVALKGKLQGQDVSVETLFSEDIAKLKSKTDTYHSEEQRAKRQIESILPIYRLRAESFVEKRSIATIAKQIDRLVDGWASSVRDHWDRSDPLFEIFVLNAIHIIVRSSSKNHRLIDKLLDCSERIIGYSPCNLYLSVADILSYHPAYRDIALELVGKIKSQWCKSNIRASEVTSRLMKCSGILLRIDAEQSKQYFDEAMKAASGVDDDAPFFLKGVANVSRYCASNTPHEIRTRLAVGLKTAIEQYWPIMDEEEHVPWGDYVQAISSLDSDIGLEAVFDMDDKGWLYLSRVSAELSCGLLDGGQLEKAYAISLHEFGLVGEGYTENSLRVLADVYATDLQMAKKIFDKISRDIMRDSPAHIRASLCNRLIASANKYNMSHSVISQIEDCRDFYAKTTNWSDTDRYPVIRSDNRIKAEKKWLGKIRNKGVDRIEILQSALADTELSTKTLREILLEIAGRMRGGKRIDFLNVLVNYQSEPYSYCREVIPSVLNELVNRWRDTPGVLQWAQQSIPKYLADHFYELLGYSYDPALPKDITNLIESQIFDGADKANVLLPLLARNGHEFSPRTAYKLAAILGKYLSEIETANVIDGILKETLQEECKTCAQGEGNGLATFLYKCFEQPDNRMRWLAFHATRDMIYLRPEPLLSNLVDLSFRHDEPMWMSAREWLMFLFLHIAHKYPGVLIPHASKIYEHVSNEQFPHAGIQELAKRVLLRLIETETSVLTQDQKEHLSLLNEPRQLIWPRGERHIKSVEESKLQIGPRFHFDTTDTLPYWYSPLGRCFGLHRCDVVRRAERWICDVWNVSNSDCHNYSRKKERGYDWNLFSHRHGSHPTIESLSRYVERHAMFMAAGEMIRELPVVSVDDDQYGSWHNWISRKCFDADPIITSDLRSACPLQAFLHGVTSDDIMTAKTLPASIFTEQLNGHVTGSGSEWIVVAGYYTVAISDYSVSVSMESGLVSSETAKALARAMLSTEHLHEIGIPQWQISYEQHVKDIEMQLSQLGQDESFESLGIEEAGFELTPFSVDYHTEFYMHAMDPKWRGLSRSWEIVGKDFADRLGLICDPSQLNYKNKQEELIVVPQSWEEGTYDQRYDDRSSYGHRLSIRKSALKQYLKQTGKCLLIRVVISRHKRNQSSSEEYDHGQAKIFILHKNGRIEGMGRNS